MKSQFDNLDVLSPSTADGPPEQPSRDGWIPSSTDEVLGAIATVSTGWFDASSPPQTPQVPAGATLPTIIGTYGGETFMRAEPIRVVITGATGYVGSVLVTAVLDRQDFELVGAVSRSNTGRDVGADSPVGVLFTDDINEALAAAPHVLIDYSAPEPAMNWYRAAVESRVAVVAATTALDPTELQRLGVVAAANGVGIFAASNLTTTGHLMMRCARLIASFVGDVEIVEGHPPAKPDAPSGTALETAALINDVTGPRPTSDRTRLGARESRGTQVGRVHIHSLRLPGMVDHQEVIFSKPGELVTIRTESFSPVAFVEPTLRAAKLILRERGLVRDLPGIFEPEPSLAEERTC